MDNPEKNTTHNLKRTGDKDESNIVFMRKS
jgi:hypothetical protein